LPQIHGDKMTDLFPTFNPTVQALCATLFTWAITAAGAGLVFLFKRPNKMLLDAMLGFAAGVMTAASFWSLLMPAIETAQMLGLCEWLTVLVGFLGGGALLFIGDRIMAYFERKNAVQNKRKRSLMLIFSITLHNIPEGMAVGVAFGSAACGLEGATLTAACMLALGIGIQNFPEGAAVSVPLRRDGASLGRSFAIGQLSGAVEPVAGIIGAAAVMQSRALLPYLLSFAAGAMIYVVVDELIPESQTNDRKDIMALFTLIGFSVMMVLDVALG
jgi:ZIP family zinc transporter